MSKEESTKRMIVNVVAQDIINIQDISSDKNLSKEMI
jgi:hypothetical protein